MLKQDSNGSPDFQICSLTFPNITPLEFEQWIDVIHTKACQESIGDFTDILNTWNTISMDFPLIRLKTYDSLLHKRANIFDDMEICSEKDLHLTQEIKSVVEFASNLPPPALNHLAKTLIKHMQINPIFNLQKLTQEAIDQLKKDLPLPCELEATIDSICRALISKQDDIEFFYFCLRMHFSVMLASLRYTSFFKSLNHAFRSFDLRNMNPCLDFIGKSFTSYPVEELTDEIKSFCDIILSMHRINLNQGFFYIDSRAEFIVPNKTQEMDWLVQRLWQKISP